MKVRIVSSYEGVQSDYFDVTEDELKVLKEAFNVEVVKSKEDYLTEAYSVIREREERQKRWGLEKKKNEEKAAKAKATRQDKKEKELREKIMKELGLET